MEASTALMSQRAEGTTRRGETKPKKGGWEGGGRVKSKAVESVGAGSGVAGFLAALGASQQISAEKAEAAGILKGPLPFWGLFRDSMLQQVSHRLKRSSHWRGSWCELGCDHRLTVGALNSGCQVPQDSLEIVAPVPPEQLPSTRRPAGQAIGGSWRANHAKLCAKNDFTDMHRN